MCRILARGKTGEFGLILAIGLVFGTLLAYGLFLGKNLLFGFVSGKTWGDHLDVDLVLGRTLAVVLVHGMCFANG
jgi:hypothetical protein